MGDKTSIEWTRGTDGSAGATWNPIRARAKRDGKVGWHCEHVSDGCRNCYAERMNKRLGTDYDFKPGWRDALDIFLDEKTLTAPLRWKRPRNIFVCSMTDLFGEWVKDEWLDRMFAVMALTPQHHYQVLTKRAALMREYFLTDDGAHNIDCEMEKIAPQYWCARELQDYGGWPLKNVWLGVSAEDQQRADERIPLLLETPAAVRFVSLEPLLGPIDLTNHEPPDDGYGGKAHGWSSIWKNNAIGRAWLDWVIVGGESGPQARPMHPAWATSLRDQCAMAGIPFFMKQWGEFGSVAELGFGGHERKEIVTMLDPHPAEMIRVGKKAAGRTLDGVEHNGMPK